MLLCFVKQWHIVTKNLHHNVSSKINLTILNKYIESVKH